MKKVSKDKRFWIACGFSAALSSSLILGQDADQPLKSELDTTVVIGRGFEGFESTIGLELAGSIDQIGRNELDYEHPDDTLELFSKIPGVNIARYNQGIINTDIGIRGFGTDGVTPHAKLLIDGIPSNLHNGYNELDQMFPLAIGGIEVFRGTSDLRYGLYNVAGSYNVFSRTDLGNEFQTTIDSFGSYEAQAYTGFEKGGLTQNYFLGYRQGRGYRDHSDIEKFTLSGRWAYEVESTLTIGLSARYSEYQGDSPGYLDRATAANNPRSSSLFASQDGGEKDVSQLSIFAEKEFENAQLSLRGYFNDVTRNRFVRFSQAGSLRNRIDDQQISGVIADLNLDVSDELRLKAGFEFQNQFVVDQRFNAVSDPSSPTGFLRSPDFSSVRRNWDHDLQTIGGYLGVEQDLTPTIRWNAGVRVDKLDGDFTNVATGADASLRDFDVVVQPKLNLFYDPIDSITLFANYGRTFQAPFGIALYQTNNQNIDINNYDGGELGIIFRPTEESSIRFSVWNQVSSNEFQDDQINFTGFREIGKVDRRGVELAYAYEVSENLTFWGNVAYSKSEIEEDSAVFPGTAGNEVRGTPRVTYSAGASYQFTPEFSARLVVDGQGNYYINENNLGGKFGDYSLLSLGFDYELPKGRLSLQVNNLLDREYEYVYDFSSDGTSSIHSPGDGINASLSYTVGF